MVKSKLGYVVLGAALALLLSGGCDSPDRIQLPELKPNSDIILTTVDPSGNVRKLMTYKTPRNTESAWALIGKDGGTVTVDGHSLVVPKDAVRDDTYFIMTSFGGDTIHVDLTAIQASDRREVKQFRKNVTLNLSYADADVQDPSRLIVAWLPSRSTRGAARVPVAGVIDRRAQVVSAQLQHFSDYALGEN